jgi:hypothetical protein
MPLRKSKIKLFQEVKLSGKRSEAIALIFICLGIFGLSAFASGKVLFDYNQREKRAEIYAVGNVLAAENQKTGNTAGTEENNSPEGKKVSKAMADAAGSVKNLTARAARAKKLAREQAAKEALLRAAPVPSAPTERANGKRVCEKKNDKPHDSKKTSKPHMDMECCPDPDEWPNPHCHYTPEQLSRMLKPPK